MELSDSHCHLHMLDLGELGGDLSLVMDACHQNEVKHLLCVGTTLDDISDILQIAKQYPEQVNAALGLHPNETTGKEPDVEQLLSLASDPKIIAIGETGLDYYRNEGDPSVQQQRFRTHIQAALITKKPLIIHTRNARKDTLNILKEENAREVRGVFHCFTEDWHTAAQAMDLGFYISFSGIVTFKNARELQEVAAQVPLDRMLIETDAPYLAPVPHRGKMNQPSFVKHVAEFIAQYRKSDLETIADSTTRNYKELFKLS
jgi:TatD DNase family protein